MRAILNRQLSGIGHRQMPPALTLTTVHQERAHGSPQQLYRPPLASASALVLDRPLGCNLLHRERLRVASHTTTLNTEKAVVVLWPSCARISCFAFLGFCLLWAVEGSEPLRGRDCIGFSLAFDCSHDCDTFDTVGVGSQRPHANPGGINLWGLETHHTG